MESPSNTNKRVRLNSDESNSPESKRIRPDFREDFLDVLEDSETNPELESFMKSFENEISNSVAGEYPPDLEFLFEASDDELGLPPADITPVESEKTVVLTESVELDGFDYAGDDFEFNTGDNDDEYVKIDGVFECPDVGFGSPETMPAR